MGNNPINYADTDGHKALGSTIKNAFSAIADAARNGVRNAQNQTGRAAEIATAKAGDGAAAVSMATNRITKNEVNGVNRGTTKGGRRSRVRKRGSLREVRAVREPRT